MGSSFVVLVEGRNDREVCRHLLGQHSLHFLGTRNDQLPYVGIIKDEGGITELIEALPVEMQHSGLEALAIVVDADVEIGSRWESLRNAVRNAGYSDMPVAPNPEGTIVSEKGKPLVGVWIMPNNANTGILEDFAAALIPKADALWPRVQHCVDSIPPEQRPFMEGALPKVKIHTWLAWQQDPGARMGEAINRKYLDPHSPPALGFVQWIRRMIEQKPTLAVRPTVLVS